MYEAVLVLSKQPTFTVGCSEHLLTLERSCGKLVKPILFLVGNPGLCHILTLRVCVK